MARWLAARLLALALSGVGCGARAPGPPVPRPWRGMPWACSAEFLDRLRTRIEARRAAPTVPRNQSALVHDGRCALRGPELERARRRVIAQMDQQLDRARDAYLIEGCGPRRGVKPPLPPRSGPRGLAWLAARGVDQPDFVKIDGQLLFAATGGALRIFDVSAPAHARLVSKTPLRDEPWQLFVRGNRVLVYEAVGPFSQEFDCGYGFDCVPKGDGTPTRLTLFDVSSPSSPRVLRRIELSGSLVTARAIGSRVHSVTYEPIRDVDVPGVRYVPDGEFDTPEAAEAAFERLRQKNRELIQASPDPEPLPRAREYRRGPSPDGVDTGGQLPRGPCALHVHDPALASGFISGFTSVVSLDLDAAGPVSSSIVASYAGFPYLSGKSFYFAVFRGVSQETEVLAFDLASGSPRYVASGRISGQLLNPGFLDEHAGALRIVTTVGQPPNPPTFSRLSVLRPEGATLREVGRLEPMAPGERLRAIRFQEERALLVTHKQTDPVSMLDLGNPEAPRVLAELDIPGFSTYMQLIDRAHLLTVGFDPADPQEGDRKQVRDFTGVLLQLFDVSVPTAPRLLHREVIGTGATRSGALYDSLTFTYHAPMNLLALPMEICEGGGPWSLGSLTFSGLVLHDVSVARGFRERGRVSRLREPEHRTWCSGGWFGSDSEVKRTLLSTDYVFIVRASEIQIRSLADPSGPGVTLPLVDEVAGASGRSTDLPL